MNTYYYLCRTKVLEITGKEKYIKDGSQEKRIIVCNDGTNYVGKYYNSREEAIEALLSTLEKKRISQKKAAQRAQEEFDETIRIISHWERELKQDNKDE